MSAIPGHDPEKEEPSELPSDVHPAHRPLSILEPSDVERTRLTAHQDHDADIASNEGRILNAKEEVKPKQNIALHPKVSKVSDTQAQTTGDLEKSSQENVTEEIDPDIIW
ncbi:hypothetical protein OCU04_011815 [Sclerotinia nivalis]|uniref:Uncharacterized protein n=1 Tax=Sclerotinia nivalis TaxID=352851 RepID=A0A9X0A9N9_9HELO|nr:hypothetical protein OCU04_011815 [Sclerotinia nivalis]